MEQLHRLETTFAHWYNGAPHLPKNGRDWLADNVWWMALVGVILGALALAIAVPLLFTSLSLTSTLSSYVTDDAIHRTAVGMAWTGLALSVVSMVASVVLLTMAVNHLKVKNKQGWNLVFWLYLINFVLNVIGAVVLLNLGGLLSAVLGVAIGGYFLFEIRDNFGSAKSKKAVKAKKA